MDEFYNMYNIKDMTIPRLYELHSGDVIYCNTLFINDLGYDHDLTLGTHIYIDSIGNNPIARVTKVFKEKKYPNKKWWQFWIKQEEYVTGYYLEIM